jgi:hypothetical protein
MNLPPKGELHALMAQQKTPCISIFLPAHGGGGELRRDVLRFRNQIREAENLLLLKNLRSSQVEDILKPIRTLVEDEQFWLHPADGIAVFRSPDVFHAWRLPYTFQEQVIVTTHFYLRPLLPLVLDNGRFYILALSQKEVRLLESTHDSIHEIDLPEAVPRSPAEAVKYDEQENELQYHSSASGDTIGKRGRHAAISHGRGVGMDDEKDTILRYFQQVDHGLRELLRDEKVPLVLAGVEFLLPIYRNANTYPHLLHEGIPGNPDRESAEVLLKRAWPVVAPYFKKSREEATASYNSYKGTARASNDISTIIPAAYYGRIESLFMAQDQEQWGTFNTMTSALHVHRRPRFGDDDLLNIAASQTLLHNGLVFAVEQVDMPDEGLVVAVFRY